MLCLHTLRADCNGLSIVRMKLKCTFASTRPVQIATKKCNQDAQDKSFASTRPVQIATSKCRNFAVMSCLCLHTPRADCNAADLRCGFIRHALCLHTPRADCNAIKQRTDLGAGSLPPHAPCRLQLPPLDEVKGFLVFASTRPVQIATRLFCRNVIYHALCLHTPRADCNSCRCARRNSNCALPPHAPCRLQPLS